MTTTDIKEKGLEDLIEKWLITQNGYEKGTMAEYNRDYAIDEVRLFRFLNDTQPKKIAELHILDNEHETKAFLNRLNNQLISEGIINLLRKGIKHKHLTLDLYYALPSKQNETAVELYSKNIFSVTRQVQYSKSDPRLAVDMVIFINGLPIITCELKNQLTKQNVDDAVHQYKTDRDSKELLFSFKRCMVHFAVDDNEIKMCTELNGKGSWFLPFNKGNNDSAGNPVNPNGLKTDYWWKEILTKSELSNIIENYAQVVEEKDEDTGKKKYKQIFPRYHQLKVVEYLLADSSNNGVGQRYLIQHSAGSGKSNSIAWLAHQLVTLEKDNKKVFDSVIVVTDRINLDKQIKNTIRQFMQVGNTVGWAERSGDLKTLLAQGKKIIITIVHKFGYILDDISTDNKNFNFAIIIDEAHSSQNGSMSAKMNIALSGSVSEDEDEFEDKINTIIEGRKMVSNASYYAFTATPKNKTLEMFGKPLPPDKEGKIQHIPHHSYTMKQAIEEGFILDVLKYYMPLQSYYKIAKTIEDDPMFDKKKAQKKLRAYVESNSYAISQKAEIVVEHFHTQIIAKGKIGGKARAMVVTSSIERALEYYNSISKALIARNSPFKAIVAFSGEKEFGGKTVNEALMNDFPSNLIEKKFRKDPYRILVVANKFQTGFDEPLLHTMYVDKILTDIKAVQTLSRLNRAAPQKYDTFVLDFANDVDTIKEAFNKYYKTTILSEESDPNKLNDLVDRMTRHQVYTDYHVDNLVELFLNGAQRDKIDPVLDECVENYNELDEDAQVEFKGSAKGFVRTYGFLGAILPYGNIEWEKLSIFLNLLIPKLPIPKGDDLSKGIIEAIDLDSYRVQAQEQISIKLDDEDAIIDPVPTGTPIGKTEAELDLLSNILNQFHTLFGDIDWTDADKVKKQIAELIPTVSKDIAYQNAMKNADKQNARAESDRALSQAVFDSMSVGMELLKHFQNNPSFKKWLSEMVFNATYQQDVPTNNPPV